jgi:two-component system, OmpR family, phosphate regulon sensor histidine kinase PhoR
MGAIFRGLLRRQTYVSALFIATRLPLGFFYFCVVAIGLAAGLTGALVLVGIPAIVLSFALAWAFAAFERQLVRWWLGVDIAPLQPPRPPGRSLFARVRDHLTNAVTWKSILYLLLQLPAGLVAFALEVFGLSVTVALTLAPVWYLLDRLTYQPTDVQFQGLLLIATGSAGGIEPRGLLLALLLSVAGFVLLTWVLWVLDKVAAGWGAVASRMLGISDTQARLAEAHSAVAAERRRAELADQSQRELIVNLSHELRTPIASIRAHVESLTMRDTEIRLDPEVVRYLDVVARETERLSALVDDLLAVARAEAGELQLTVSPVSVVQVVRHVREALGPMARSQRRVTLLDRLPDGGVPLVLADPDRLTQVMMNLVRNAVTYTPEGGLVSIEAAGDGPGHVALSVADTGIGIAAEDLPRVFERFYRTDASRARSTGGFGLGLSIARDLVVAMGGTITVESEEGAGSRFTVRLPVARPAEVPA